MARKPLLHYLRRIHLYLALFCMPWFVMYGVSSLAFTHPEWFEAVPNLYNTQGGEWTQQGEWPCDVTIPEEGDIPYDVATALVQAAGIDAGAYGAYRSGPRQVDVYVPKFWTMERLSYRIDDQRIAHYRRAPTVGNILTSMHARAGYQHNSVLNDAWAVMVDVTMIGFLLWVATGLVIWWTLPGLRGWGWAGLGAGVFAFVLFMLLL